MMTIPSGVVLQSWRTRTQASLSFICAWEYAEHFLREVPRHWPSLALWCMVEEDSDAFGGILTIREGQRRDLVKPQGVGYDARGHAQRVGGEMKHWRRLVGAGDRSRSDRGGRTARSSMWMRRSTPMRAGSTSGPRRSAGSSAPDMAGRRWRA